MSRFFVLASLVIGWIHPGWSLARAAEPQRVRGSIPVAATTLQPVGELPKTQALTLVVGLPLRNGPELDALLRELYDPASPKYRQFLTPDQFTAEFGPSEADYHAVADFARSNHLAVVRTHANRTVLNLRGSVADIEQAFNVRMLVYNHPTEGRTFYAPDRDPALALDVPVLSISGLNNYQLPHPASLHKVNRSLNSGAYPLANGSGPASNYIGNDFRAAYVPGVSLTGSGQTVALLEFDGYYASDIESYEQLAGLPDVTLTNVFIDGANGYAGPNSDEVSLDIEMAISMAPGLSAVVVYENGSENGDDMLSEMAKPTQGEPLSLQISSSWIFSTDATTESLFKEFAAQGQSYFNASGDSDAYSSGNPMPSLAGDTNITIVGGTTLTTSGPQGSYVSETAWQWGYDSNAGQDVGTGGGISSFPIPPWQQGISMVTNQGSTVDRNIPDVALTADNVWVIYGGGQSGAYGGTSCATPLWAGFMSLVHEQAAAYGRPPLGFINSTIYALAKGPTYSSCFHDIITGNNTNNTSTSLYQAVAGYDLCTGWGTPSGANLINLLAPPGLLITPSSGFLSTGYVGGPFSITNQTFTLSNLTSSSLSWTLVTNSSWLSASANSGTLAGGNSTNVNIGLGTAAYGLGPGTYSSSISVSNGQNTIVQTIQFGLTATESLLVSPAAGFVSTGYVGGPFSITSQVFTLTNLSAETLNWALGNTSVWLNVSSSGGAVAPEASTSVTFSLGAVAASLAPGTYSNTVFLTNLADGTVFSRRFSLTLAEPLVLSPAGGFVSTGYVGGPFSITNESFTLSNLSAQAVSWALANTSAWVQASADAGTLPAGASGSLSFALTSTATNLVAGAYTNVVWLTNLVDDTVFRLQFALQIQPLPEPLQISPATGFSSVGTVGGPFSVTSQTFGLTNIGHASLNWSLSNTSAWLSVSAASGSLAPGVGTTLTVSLNSLANSLPLGGYNGTLWFTNLADLVGQARVFALSVTPEQLVVNGGFEAGNFTGWTESGTSGALGLTAVTQITNLVHSGAYAAGFGSPNTHGYGVASISQTLPTAAGQLYVFSFWLYCNGETPNRFVAYWNGTNGTTVFNESNMQGIGWTNVIYIGRPASSNTVIELGGEDNPYYLGLDDVSVVPVLPPRLQGAVLNGGGFNLSWTALAGLGYQVQYKTNLLQTTWSNLGGVISGNNFQATLSDPITGPQRFYRVLIQP